MSGFEPKEIPYKLSHPLTISSQQFFYAITIHIYLYLCIECLFCKLLQKFIFPLISFRQRLKVNNIKGEHYAPAPQLGKVARSPRQECHL